MPYIVEIVLGSPPVPQPRHRIATRGRFANAYVPKEHAIHAWKTLIKLAAYREYKVGPIWKGPVHCRVSFAVPRPKSHYGKGRNCLILKPSAPIYPTKAQTGDLDNLLKALWDACEGILFKNDSQIVHVDATKVYAGPAREAGLRVTFEGEEDVI